MDTAPKDKTFFLGLPLILVAFAVLHTIWYWLVVKSFASTRVYLYTNGFQALLLGLSSYVGFEPT